MTDLSTSITSLLGKLKCNFLNPSLVRVYHALCVSFIPTIYTLAKVIIVISMGLLFGSCMLYCTANRYGMEHASFNKKVKTE